MPLLTDTTQARNVSATALKTASQLFPGSSPACLRAVFDWIETLFTGGHPDYAANDLQYHDFQHTLQVTAACVDLLAARQRAAAPPLSFRHFELGLIAALFHDSGYLKLHSDTQGTGAKYTYCHVLRGCALAASALPPLGVNAEELGLVLGCIRNTATGPAVAAPTFRNASEQWLADAVATADYLGQMAAEDYPRELEFLFREFSESDDFLGIPAAARAFPSLEGLIAGTPAFWAEVIRPRLDKKFQGICRLLDAPDGTNPYLDAIERNIRLIARNHPAATP